MITDALNRKFCIAPMMDLTDRHFRYFFRLISKNALLYSEMVTSAAVVHGDQQHLLQFNEQEHPVALQLGGSDPKQLSEAAVWGQRFAYSEVNLNVGCPSDRVQSGKIGAILMTMPHLVADCVKAMQDAVELPITVKCRIGIDDEDSYEFLQHFIHTVAATGCTVFLIHARKAWLKGLSPKENREIPELNYSRVYRLKKEFPELEFIVNGGITDPVSLASHLDACDGVMVGREAYYNPYAMLEFERQLFPNPTFIPPSREELALQYLAYMQKQIAVGVPLSHMSRHLIPLYQSVPGARAWRRCLSEKVREGVSAENLIEQALSVVSGPKSPQI